MQVPQKGIPARTRATIGSARSKRRSSFITVVDFPGHDQSVNPFELLGGFDLDGPRTGPLQCGEMFDDVALQRQYADDGPDRRPLFAGISVSPRRQQLRFVGRAKVDSGHRIGLSKRPARVHYDGRVVEVRGCVDDRLGELSGIGRFENPAPDEDALGDSASPSPRARRPMPDGRRKFFEAVPEGGDAYVMKHIIHDWDDERALLILRNVRKAMNRGGRVILIESVVLPGNQPDFAKIIDLEMLLLPGGRERTEAEFRALFAAAGLEMTRIGTEPVAAERHRGAMNEGAGVTTRRDSTGAVYRRWRHSPTRTTCTGRHSAVGVFFLVVALAGFTMRWINVGGRVSFAVGLLALSAQC